MILLWIDAQTHGQDFCAGAEYDFDPPICVRAAPKLDILVGRGLHKAIELCELRGWRHELFEVPESRGSR